MICVFGVEETGLFNGEGDLNYYKVWVMTLDLNVQEVAQAKGVIEKHKNHRIARRENVPNRKRAITATVAIATQKKSGRWDSERYTCERGGLWRGLAESAKWLWETWESVLIQ